MKVIDIKAALKSRFGPAQRRHALKVARALRRRAAIVLDQGRLVIKAKMLERGYDFSFVIPRTVVLIGIVTVFLLWAVLKMWHRRRRSLTKMFVTPKVDSLAPACSSSARPPLPQSSPSPTTAPISLRRCPSQRQTAEPPISPLDPPATTTTTAAATKAATVAAAPPASTSADIRALQLGQEQLSKAVAALLAWRTEKEASSPIPHPVDNTDLLDDLDSRVTKTEENLVEVVHEVQRTTLKLDEWAGLPQAHAWVSEMVKSLLAWRAQTLAKESTAPVYATKAEMELANAQARETYEKLAAAMGAEVSKVLKELQASYEDKKGGSYSTRRASVTAVKSKGTWQYTKVPASLAKVSKDVPLFKRLADGGPASHATQADDE